MEIRPVGAELFHTQDMTKLIVAFRNFAKAPKKNLELLLLLVIPVVRVTTLAHDQDIPYPTLPLLLPICSQFSSNQYQREAFS
jgi:hypothetical protein